MKVHVPVESYVEPRAASRPPMALLVAWRFEAGTVEVGLPVESIFGPGILLPTRPRPCSKGSTVAYWK